ncbi:hypothetical protein IFM89_017054 [Coptis chinensis]|uniref:Calcineurin B-like protein n=1 Tax=Coptis chinensis TaxID=261450 RepID=A0A835LRU6_9MAGN|nr:hypothetical protein IFM89_017054 [Coptis chinensis]
MVLALLIESDLTLTEDVVETIVDKTFTDADSKGDGRTNMHQMAARNEEPCLTKTLEDWRRTSKLIASDCNSLDPWNKKQKSVLDLFDVKRNGVIESGEYIRSLGIFHPTLHWRRKLHLEEMVLALLIDSDLALTEDVVETIVGKTFTDADSKGDGRTNMHQMAARNEEPCLTKTLEDWRRTSKLIASDCNSLDPWIKKQKSVRLVACGSYAVEKLGMFVPTVLLDKKEISGDQYPAETPVRHLLEEESLGNLPFFEMERERDFELSLLTESKGDLH